MKKYLSTIHERSNAHKKRFALLVSGTITLFIFAIWSFVNFGLDSEKMAQDQKSEEKSGIVDPGFKAGVAAAFQAVKQSFGTFKEDVEKLEEVIPNQ